MIARHPSRDLLKPVKSMGAMVLGRVKRWVLAMLACSRKLRVAALPPLRGAFDSPCAPCPSEGIGTKGVPQKFDRASGGSN